MLDKKDLEILRIIQKNSRISAKDIARSIESPITTVYAKIKRMENLGIIKEYKTMLDPKKLGRGATAFILVSISYEAHGKKLSQREIAKKISEIPYVQEAHIVSGDWDILVKVRAKDVEEIGKLVIDKLRLIEGVEKTLTMVVFDTVKETLELTI
jgi:DNA-binding Lrp family transcriptional regulator